MKQFKSLMLLVLMAGFWFQNAYAQGVDLECPAPMSGSQAAQEMNLNQLGGIYLTANGQIRVLVVYVRFKDDNSPHNHWPAGSPPPQMNEIIDPNMSTGSTNFDNFTHYFDVMSLGQYDFVGDTIYVETPQNMSAYGTPPSRSLATEDVLKNVVDPIVDFSLYDNWTPDSTYHHTNKSDGIVDMIIMIWRGLVFTTEWGGEASLGRGPDIITNDGVTIKQSYPTGSGITVQFWGDRSENYNFKNAVHELGHWLVSGSHPYHRNLHPQKSLWGMLTRGFDGICANAFERERLGWINAVPVTGTVTAPLADYITSGVAYKYHPSNGATNEFYYFENHQKLNSTYDDATVNSNDKGVFVIHQKDIYRGQNNIRALTADGDWDWEHALTTDCPSSANLPAFRQTSVNTSGTNHRSTHPKSGGGWQWVYALADDNNNVSCGNFRGGEAIDDSYNSTITNVFSPWSNPNTYTWDGNDTDFGMEVLNQSGNVINAKFYVGNPEDAPPAKPMDLRATSSGTYQPVVLNWEPNTEDDMKTGGKYKIYRAEVYGTGEPSSGAFVNVATINAYNGATPVTSWTDYETFAYNSSSWVHYKIKAMDNTNKTSTFSNKTKYNAVVYKVASDEQQIVQAFELMQNYPNPFNPTTTFAFALPESAPVRLTIFDLNGRQVAQLINEELPAGRYEIPFDASSLASGVYLYRLSAGSLSTGSPKASGQAGQGFSQVRKMMLIK